MDMNAARLSLAQGTVNSSRSFYLTAVPIVLALVVEVGINNNIRIRPVIAVPGLYAIRD